MSRALGNGTTLPHQPRAGEPMSEAARRVHTLIAYSDPAPRTVEAAIEDLDEPSRQALFTALIDDLDDTLERTPHLHPHVMNRRRQPLRHLAHRITDSHFLAAYVTSHYLVPAHEWLVAKCIEWGDLGEDVTALVMRHPDRIYHRVLAATPESLTTPIGVRVRDTAAWPPRKTVATGLLSLTAHPDAILPDFLPQGLSNVQGWRRNTVATVLGADGLSIEDLVALTLADPGTWLGQVITYAHRRSSTRSSAKTGSGAEGTGPVAFEARFDQLLATNLLRTYEGTVGYRQAPPGEVLVAAVPVPVAGTRREILVAIAEALRDSDLWTMPRTVQAVLDIAERYSDPLPRRRIAAAQRLPYEVAVTLVGDTDALTRRAVTGYFARALGQPS